AEVLGTPVATKPHADPRLAAEHALVRARYHFWQTEYGAAIAVLDEVGTVPADTRVRLAAAGARAAIAVGDAARARRCVAAAREHAHDAAGQARAWCAAGFVQLSLGDVEAAAASLHAGLAAARSAREPQRALRGQLLLAECERRCGRPAAAQARLARVRRVEAEWLPAILRVRAELLETLLGAPGIDDEHARRVAESRALPALVCYATDRRQAVEPGGPLDIGAATIVSVLQTCHAAADEESALTDVCVRVRRYLVAAAVSIHVHVRGVVRAIAASGARVGGESAVPVPATCQSAALGVHQGPSSLNVPIRYAGAVVGALAVRWPVPRPPAPVGTRDWLAMVGAAVAPLVGMHVSRLERPPARAAEALVGRSAPMETLRRAVCAAAAAPFPVLVEGESGSGKELVARAIHRLGPRRDKPFGALNCAALPDDLVESELFGHARGAFTGAVGERAGVFEDAHGGTLFLDEVGELSLRAQAKLLRVCQEGEVRRLGDTAVRRVDVRLVCATNRDLRQEAAAGRFRHDLLYRLDIVRIAIPPLRERGEDVTLLADHFWQEMAAKVGKRAVLAAATREALARYAWPGNVRELQNALASLAVRAPNRGIVGPEMLPVQFVGGKAAPVRTLGDARRGFEREFVRATLARAGGRPSRAAAELGVTRQGLTKLIARLDIRA
ncbi:MAG: sigma 54-interacting transcriptional regulator, partial [Acidobacteriota bacterium]